MSSLRFTKMHGCGNDYVYVDAWHQSLPEDLPALARRISDRHLGVGSDGLIILARSTAADARMIMFNADGSQSEMCGNGIRCAAKLAFDHRRVQRKHMSVETGAGILGVDLMLEGNACTGASILMGKPRLEPSEVPVVHDGPGPLLELEEEVAGMRLRLLAVGMGNPHAVCFVPEVECFPVATVGPILEQRERFPRRTNVEFVCRLRDEDGVPVLRQRTWERGAGETLACGTGACAATVAAILDQRIPSREAVVRLSGGDLQISWLSDDAQVRMTGPAVTVFEGEYPL